MVVVTLVLVLALVLVVEGIPRLAEADVPAPDTRTTNSRWWHRWRAWISQGSDRDREDRTECRSSNVARCDLHRMATGDHLGRWVLLAVRLNLIVRRIIPTSDADLLLRLDQALVMDHRKRTLDRRVGA